MTYFYLLDVSQFFKVIAKNINDNLVELITNLDHKMYPMIQNVRNQERNVNDQAYKLLTMWHQKNHPHAGIDRLIEVLKNINRNDIVEKIKSEIEKIKKSD